MKEIDENSLKQKVVEELIPCLLDRVEIYQSDVDEVVDMLCDFYKNLEV